MAGNEMRTRRLNRELNQLKTNSLSGISVDEEALTSSLETWLVTVEGAKGTLYEDEEYQLQFKFTPKYPFESPQQLPPDNDFYVKTCSKNPKKTRWWFHDDNV